MITIPSADSSPSPLRSRSRNSTICLSPDSIWESTSFVRTFTNVAERFARRVSTRSRFRTGRLLGTQIFGPKSLSGIPCAWPRLFLKLRAAGETVLDEDSPHFSSGVQPRHPEWDLPLPPGSAGLNVGTLRSRRFSHGCGRYPQLGLEIIEKTSGSVATVAAASAQG